MAPLSPINATEFSIMGITSALWKFSWKIWWNVWVLSKTPLKSKTTTLRNRVGQQVKSTSTDFIAEALTTSTAASKNLIQVENLVQILPASLYVLIQARSQGFGHSCSQSAWSMFTLFTVSVFGLLDPHLGPSFPLLMDFLLPRHSSNHFRE